MYDAYAFFESDRFDEAARLAGYESLFIKNTFRFIQDVITKRKQLYADHKKDLFPKFLKTTPQKPLT